MERIDNRTVKLTDTEWLLAEIHSLLLDQGYSEVGAVELLLGSNVPPYLRSETPVLDSVITPEFVKHLRGEG